MAAIYNGLEFRTPLEAQWAAFFDLAKWEWRVNPAPVGNWAPDFRVTFPCSHSECSGSHTLLVAVLPASKIEDFNAHPSISHNYGIHDGGKGVHSSVDAGAAFGTSPEMTKWEMAHGAGGGLEEVSSWVGNAGALWEEAARRISRT